MFSRFIGVYTTKYVVSESKVFLLSSVEEKTKKGLFLNILVEFTLKFGSYQRILNH